MLDERLPNRAVRYLDQVLGDGAVRVKGGGTRGDLPYFLQDTYEVVTGEVLGREIALTCLKGPHAPPVGQMDRHVRTMHEQLRMPVIVALPQVSATERKRLIENGVAFVVPGRQLYAPQLGMILSEHFPLGGKRELARVSPATQALLIWYLLHDPVTALWQPSADAAALGYTAMTASRAVRELLQLNCFELEVRGRAKLLKLTMTRRQLWEKALPHLATPVQRSLWTDDRRMLQMHDVRLAGESALARHSTLNGPAAPVVAVTSDVITEAQDGGVRFEQRQLGDGIEVQVWRYRPTIESKSQTADRLSVWLSLRGAQDPRIQMALDELDGAFPW